MRQKEKKYFGDIQSGRLNGDDSPFALTTNEWVNAENIRTGTTDNGFTGIVESVGGNSIITPPDTIYKEITIGSQIWMGDDLNVTKYRNGDDILYISDATEWTNAKQGAWCWANNDPSTNKKLYNWYAVSDSRGLAPDGWRVSTINDFTTLNNFSTAMGAKLKIMGTLYWDSPNTGATNTYNFDAKGNGLRTNTGTFSNFKQNAYYWTSNNSATPTYYYLSYNSADLSSTTTSLLTRGFSVRCVKESNLKDYITIGSVEDIENNRILYFNYDSYGNHNIVCLYTDTNKQYYVLFNNQVVGGLNFSKDSLIHSAKISGNILSWTDGTNNEPRKINIESAIAANYSSFITTENLYSFPLNFSEITVIKRPPVYTPNIVKTIDNSFPNNFIQFESFEFAFQYQYWDNETTVVGSYSQTSKLNFPDEKYNSIVVSLDAQEQIPDTVRIISLIVRYGNGNPTGSTNASVVYKWDKKIPNELALIQSHNNGTSVLQYSFYNNLSGNSIAEDDVLRAFDNVPIYSQTHEIAKSRYFFANNTEGYETPKTTSLYAKLGDSLTLSADTYSCKLYFIKTGWYTNINYFKIWSTFGLYVYIPGIANYSAGYYLLNLTGDYAFQQNFGTNNKYPSTTFPFPTGLPTTIDISQCSYKGVDTNQVFNITRPPSGKYVPTLDPGLGSQTFNTNKGGLQEVTEIGSINVTGLTNTKKQYNILSNKSIYKYGIVFYDYAMRKCGVCDKTSNTNYYQVFTQSASVKSSNRIFGGQNIIYVRFSATPLGDIIVGDKITITSGTMAGDYPVSNILNYNYDGTYWYYTLEIPTATIPTQSAYYSTTVNVNRLQTLQVIAPSRNYSYTSAFQNTTWFLNNTNAINEIPTWAYYYSIVRTLNLKTRFFIQSFSNALQYVTRDSTGAFVYNNNYSSTGVGIGIHTAALLNSGLGYTYTEKDMCVLWNSSGSVWELPVIGQDGNYIHLKNTNIGQLNTSTNKNFIYEIYTPYQEQINEPYYEIGEIYSISNPTLSTRNYSAITGSIAGDTYAFTRAFQSNNFIVGAMSPNDLFWKVWETDAGKVNVVTKLSQTVKNTNITWSDTFISGTQINGTSTFRFGNETYVSDDCGSINKLQLTSKVQDQGTVMLSLCTAETNSMYLGETQITDSTGKVQFFTSSKDVISTINTLKGNYGCINPESVTQYRGKVYFVDTNNGRVVQYSENGLDNISSIKMNRFWKNYLKKYNETSPADIEIYGSRPFIFSVVDPYHDELLISIPKLSITPAHGWLPDYTTIVYPFDIMDYMNKTMVYKLGTGAVVVPHWQGSYTFSPEYFSILQNRLFSFKNGNIYEHNQPLQNNFYGEAYYSSIMFSSNILPQIPKIYDNFVSESNIVPSFVYFYNNYPYLQTSDLDDTSFKSVEGIWYANILRNKSNGNNTFDGLLKNEVMKGNNMYVWLKFFVPSTVPLQLNLLQLGMSISKGHTV